MCLGFFVISLLISSIRSAYCRTDNSPPCLMLSFILISRVPVSGAELC